MADELFWQSEILENGLRLEAMLPSSGMIVTLRRRSIVFVKDSPPKTVWLIHSQVMVWWPSPLDETARLIGHWLDFYDPVLKSKVSGLIEKLMALPEMQTPTGAPPQGTSLN